VSRIGSLRRLAVSLAVCALLAGNVSGQSNPELSQAQESLHKVATTETAGALHEEGVPVTDPLVMAKCGSCHARHDKGNMERISWARTTPEGWQNALKRMILVKGVSLTAQEGRLIARYLSTYHGLAPEEGVPVRHIAERRIHEESNIADSDPGKACAKCHALALTLSWRRSLEDWKQFVELHSARYMFSPNAEIVAYLARVAPLHSPEWEAWSARTNLPNLAGRWLVIASMPGHGKYYGEMQVDRAGDDEFTTRANLTSVRDGSRTLRTGRSVVYGDYAWRGRSKGGEPASSAPDDRSSEAREVLWIAPDHSRAEGRWFWGQYQEFGFDVQLQRASSNTTLLAIDRVTFALERNQILGLIGPNGAGKTTLVSLVSGTLQPTEGSVLFEGKPIHRLAGFRRALLGIARTFQVMRPFPGLTVLDNVAVGALFGAAGSTRQLAAAREDANRWLHFVGLDHRARQRADALGGPDRKRLELAKALAMRPKLLLLDEVMAGLNPVEIEEVITVIKKVRDQGISIVVIEHVMKAIQSLSDRLLVLHHGEKIAEGKPEEVLRNDQVIAAYLGSKRR